MKDCRTSDEIKVGDWVTWGSRDYYCKVAKIDRKRKIFSFTYSINFRDNQVKKQSWIPNYPISHEKFEIVKNKNTKKIDSPLWKLLNE